LLQLNVGSRIHWFAVVLPDNAAYQFQLFYKPSAVIANGKVHVHLGAFVPA